MSDQGATGGDILFDILPLAERPKDITPKADKTAVWIHWPQGSRLCMRGPSSALMARRTMTGYSFPGSSPDRLSSAIWTAVSGAITNYQTIPAAVGDGRLEQSLSVAHGAMAYIKSSFSRSSRGLPGPRRVRRTRSHTTMTLSSPCGAKIRIDPMDQRQLPCSGLVALPGATTIRQRSTR